MKHNLSVIILALIFCISCKQKNDINYSTDKIGKQTTYVTTEALTDNTTPTVDLSEYTLIADSKKDYKNDAQEIFKLKRRWPLAMQSLNPLEFDAILSKDFIFKGTDSSFNRTDYIKNRTTPDNWKITFVKYDNVTLQFINGVAVLSYRNHIKNENSLTKAIEMEHITWVDVYVKEEGKWKIGSAHSIDYKLEN